MKELLEGKKVKRFVPIIIGVAAAGVIVGSILVISNLKDSKE